MANLTLVPVISIAAALYFMPTYIVYVPSAVTPGSLTFKERPHHAGNNNNKKMNKA